MSNAATHTLIRELAQQIAEIKTRFERSDARAELEDARHKAIEEGINSLNLKFDILSIEGVEGIKRGGDVKQRKTAKRIAEEDAASIAGDANTEEAAAVKKPSRGKPRKPAAGIQEDPVNIIGEEQTATAAAERLKEPNLVVGDNAEEQGGDDLSESLPAVVQPSAALKKRIGAGSKIRVKQPNALKSLDKFNYFKKEFATNAAAFDEFLTAAVKKQIETEHAAKWGAMSKESDIKKDRIRQYYEYVKINFDSQLQSMRDRFNATRVKDNAQLNEIEDQD